MKKAKDIMSEKLITVTPETTVKELAEILTENGINGTPVVDSNRKLLGVVTENDLLFQKKRVHIPTILNFLDAFIYLESPEKMKEEMQKISGTSVKDIFSFPAVTVDEDTLIDEIATLMIEKNIHTIPVVKGEKLVGIVGKGDIIKTLMNRDT